MQYCELCYGSYVSTHNINNCISLIQNKCVSSNNPGILHIIFIN